jgi:hypothetical protein
LSIARLAIESFGNRQSQIDNPKTQPLPRGGTDLIAFPDFLSANKSVPLLSEGTLFSSRN